MKREFIFILITLLLIAGGLPEDLFAQPGRYGDYGDFGAEIVIETKELKKIKTTDNDDLSPEDGINESLTDELFDQGLVDSIERVEGKTTSFLNVKDAKLQALVKTFSRITKRNYIVDGKVKGTVTIYLPTAVSVTEAITIFDAVLLMNGYTQVPVGDNTYKIIKIAEAKSTTIPLIMDSPKHPSDVLVTQFLRLKHVPADDMMKILNQFVSRGGLINAFSGTNALIIIDSAANISRLKKLIAQLDVPAIDRDVTIIPIAHSEASDIADKINDILEEENSAGNRSFDRISRSTSRVAKRKKGKTKKANSMSVGRRILPFKVIPDERTNSLLVVADPEMTAKIRRLVKKLDSPIDLSGGRFHIYRLQHADSDEIADLLNSVISGVDSSSKKPSESSTSRGSSLSRNSTMRSIQRRLPQVPQVDNRNKNLKTTTRGRVAFEDEVTIASDPKTNSLVINASRSDFLKIHDVIEELDVKRRQVIVEATILEVSLTDGKGIGVEFHGTTAGKDGGLFAQNNLGSLSQVFTNPTALSNFTLAAASSGTVTLPGGVVLPSQSVLVSALSEMKNVNVLSAPTILTTDNEEAEIVVGENIPFVTSTTRDSSNVNNTFNRVERQDVGITMRITPQISSGGFVNLQIFVEISNVVPGTRNDENGPTTTVRTTDTNVEVKSGQMIVTGGLISDSISEATRGIPFLSDIPIIGGIFGRADYARNRKNLVIFITPRIIKDQYDVRDETIKLHDEIKDMFDEHNLGINHDSKLYERRVNTVVEEYEGSIDMPGSITPPRVLPRSETTLPIINSSAEEDLAVEFYVGEGRLVKESELEEETLEISDGMMEGEGDVNHHEPEIREEKQVWTGSRTYVVFNLVKGSDARIIESDNHEIMGISLAAKPLSASSGFFHVGGRYKVKGEDEELELICVGKYSSPQQAATLYSELADENSWYHLSLEESRNLQSYGWKRDYR